MHKTRNTFSFQEATKPESEVFKLAIPIIGAGAGGEKMLTLIVIIYYVWLKLAKIGDEVLKVIDLFSINFIHKMTK